MERSWVEAHSPRNQMTQKGKDSDSDSRRQGTSETETNGDGLRQISKSLLLPRSIFTWQPSSSPFPGTPHPPPARTSHWAPLLGPPSIPTEWKNGKRGQEMGPSGLSGPHTSQGPQPGPCRHPGWYDKGGGPGGARTLRQCQVDPRMEMRAGGGKQSLQKGHPR